MNNIKWIKISCDFFDDEAIKLIEQMPESDSIIVIWLKLLISAGKTNDRGFIYFKKEIPYTDEMLSAVFNRPLNIIRLALKTFEQFGMIQITDEHEIFISNWEKHQNIAGMEQIKEYNRMAKRRQREKEKEIKLLTASQGQCQGHVIDNHETDKEKEKEIEIEIDIENTHTHNNAENEKNSCVCVELTKEEKKFLIDYAKKSKAQNIDAYIHTLIQNGGYKLIIENAKKAQELKNAQQKNVVITPPKVEISEEEHAKVKKYMQQIRQNLTKTGKFLPLQEEGEECK